MNQKIIKRIEFFIYLVEVFICIIILAAVICGIPDLLRYVATVLKEKDVIASYHSLNEFFKHALLLVVGIELIEMIISRSHESILTLILFVIARKMLVYSGDMFDILISSISIAIIFLIIKFIAKDENLIAKLDKTFSASVPLKKIKLEYGIDVPVDMANTIGGLVYELAKIENIDEIKENTAFVYGDYIYRINSMQDGVIQRVRIEKNYIKE